MNPTDFAASFECGYETDDYDDALMHAFKCPICGDDD